MIRSPNIPNKVFRHISKGAFKNRHGVLFEAEDYKHLSANVAGKIIAQNDLRSEHQVEAELNKNSDFITYN